MRTLIVYATNSSGTQAVSTIIGDALQQVGHQVTIKRAYEPGAELFDGYDLVILGSCTWERFKGQQRLEGQLQQHMYELLEGLQGKKFVGQAFAVYGLGDSSYTDFCAAVDHLEKFVTTAGGRLIIPSLRIDGFFFDLEANRRRARSWAKSLVVNQVPN